MFKLTCHRTFLDAEDGEDRPTASHRRSQSEPPDDRSEEQSYASALASRADQLHYWLRKRQQGDFKHPDVKVAATDASTDAETRDVADSLRISSKSSNASEPEISQGSHGHPEVCHRPCVNFARGWCAAGSSCDYCHLSHVETPLVTANREMRGILQQATEFDLLALASRHARARAVDKGFMHAAEDVLRRLEARLSHLDSSHRGLAQTQQGKLDRFMVKMPFSGLLGLALRKSQDSNYADQVKVAVDTLRSNLSTAI